VTKIILKNYTSYHCIWIHPSGSTYSKWLPQQSLFPYTRLTTINHNITLFYNYYTQRQYSHFNHLITIHFNPSQILDTKFITSPVQVPFITISTSEYNPEKDILTHHNTIHLQYENVHIYDNTGKYIITIPLIRLHWLWNQYQRALQTILPL
jgi:hypothetical protein